MTTLKVASFNAYNLVRAGVPFYSSKAYSEAELALKLAWTGRLIAETGAQIIGFQEVFHEAPLAEAVALAGFGAATVRAPGATPEENEADGKALGPKVGIATTLPVEALETIVDFPARAVLQVPAIHPATRVESVLDVPFTSFNRPVLKARLRLPNGFPCTVFVAHLKSKRPMLLDGEDSRDPLVRAKGAIRALLLRGAEAAALRALVLDVIRDPLPGERGEPCIVLGDLNDGIGAVSTNAVSGEPPFFRLPAEQKRPIWDVLLYNVMDIQARISLESFAYTHIWNGRHELLDHILVSQEFYRQFPKRIGEVLNARVYNDHLVDETLTRDRKDRIRSDHGVPVAEIRLAETVA